MFVTCSYTKRRSNFEGLNLKALIELDEPFTIIKSEYKTHAPYFPQNQTYLVNEFTSGLFLDVWHLLEEHFNFTTHSNPSNISPGCFKYRGKSWTKAKLNLR